MNKRRIDQASKFLPMEQLVLSPQCGFGGIDSKVLSENEMWEVGYNRGSSDQIWR
jgi:5-methyltetrahydropteroyltriglutamate--homocysteine methyltransferase